MPSTRTRGLLLLHAAPFFFLSLPRPASAQCGTLTQQFQNVALETGNAFVAEYSTTRSTTLPSIGPLSPNAGLKSVARDSEGRVRIVRSAGNYTVRETDGVVTEVERLAIWICDPTTGMFTILDTADKTATIRPSRGTPLRIIKKPKQGQERSFCATMFAMRRNSSRVTIEDLGHQLISGYDAVGIRVHFTPLGATGGEFPSSYNELWCSDVLGAVVRQANESKSLKGHELKNESTMQNIERREPEVSLFQIPSDYTVLERATEGNRLAFPRPISPPSASTNPQ